MEIFGSIDDMARVLGSHVKWQRAVQALRTTPGRRLEVASSLGDSLTFWVQADASATVFTASRRYLTVLHPMERDLEVEVAAVESLSPLDAYSDLSDREHLLGAGEVVALPRGALGVIGPSRAYRVLTAGRIAVVRVTVEGATFHNK